MAKIKLLEISDYYLPHWTGIVKSVSYMNRAIQKWFEITVLTVQHSNQLSSYENLEGVYVKRSPSAFSLSRTNISFQLFIELVREVPKHDVVFINSPSAYMLFSAIVGKMHGKKVVIFHQGDLTLPYTPLNWFIERAFDLSFGLSCLFADRVFCATKDYATNSRVLRFFLYKFFELPILATKPKHLAPNHRFTTPTFKKISELKDEGYFVFGFSGRFVEEKGFDVLLLAIETAAKINKKVRFLYAGDIHVSYENFYEKNKSQLKKVKEFVTIAGLLNDKKIEEFYSLCDAVIIPSRSDCFPTVQVEAMIRNMPVIIAGIPGARVPVQETNFGLLVKPNDPKDLADAILKMVTQYQNILKNGENVTNYFNLIRDTQTVKNCLTF